MDKYILIGLLIGVPINIIRLIVYFKHKKETKVFNGLSLFAVFLGLLYGIKGDKD